MNEKLQYAEMLNIPVNTSTVTFKPKKKALFKRLKNDDKVKEELIAKVNAEESQVALEVPPQPTETVAETKADQPENYQPTVSITRGKSRKKTEFKVNVIGVQLVIIGILAAVICLTSALVPNSGINVFFKEVFGKTQSQAVDERIYEDFSASLPVASVASVSLENGVMTVGQKASVYPPCDGVLTSLEKDEQTGKFSMVIRHNSNFKTVLSGVDYAYAEQGGSVYKNIPVGYVKESATVCFTDGNGSLITGYGINNGSVVWAA